MTKLERLEVANQLIKIISDYGRRFFYFAALDRVARLEVDQYGKIWFVDDYNNKRIYTHYKGRWRYFSHGGTLKALVLAIANYIQTGARLPAGYLGPERSFTDGNIWGYNEYAMTKVRELAGALDIIEPQGDSHALEQV